MNIDILTKNIELDNPLRVFVEDKIGGLRRFLKGDAVFIRVEIGKPSKHHKSGPVYYAEANLKVGRTLLRADARHYDLRAAITEVRDELKVEIKKFKEKIADKARRNKE